MFLLQLQYYHAHFLMPETPSPCRVESQLLTIRKPQLLSLTLYWRQKKARSQHQLGARGTRGTPGPLPLLHSGALRLQRWSKQTGGETAWEVPGRVKKHLFHWSVHCPVPPATLFLELPLPHFWESQDSGQCGDNFKEKIKGKVT